jgi:hypothetical protein
MVFYVSNYISVGLGPINMFFGTVHNQVPGHPGYLATWIVQFHVLSEISQILDCWKDWDQADRLRNNKISNSFWNLRNTSGKTPIWWSRHFFRIWTWLCQDGLPCKAEAHIPYLKFLNLKYLNAISILLIQFYFALVWELKWTFDVILWPDSETRDLTHAI